MFQRQRLEEGKVKHQPPGLFALAGKHLLGKIVEYVLFRPLQHLSEVDLRGNAGACFFFGNLTDKLKSRDPTMCAVTVFGDLLVFKLNMQRTTKKLAHLVIREQQVLTPDHE